MLNSGDALGDGKNSLMDAPGEQARSAVGHAGRGVVADGEPPDGRDRDYWTANITTVAASDRVRVRPVSLSCGRFAPYAWESKKSWYEPPNTATFLVLPLGSRATSDGTAADATTQFGVPQRTARIGAYQVMIWNHDLLPAVTSGFARGCGQQWRR
jgi:hypothetical protein